jgi:phage gp46-like protein
VADLALQWSLDAGGADLAIESDDLASDAGLRTAVELSLFTDRRANDDDALPGADDDRRGWWADEFLQVDGDRMGSRLWLLSRSKRTPDVVPRAEQFAREALAWLLEDRVVKAVDVAARADGVVLYLDVTITRPSGDAASFQFAHTWDGEAQRAV